MPNQSLLMACSIMVGNINSFKPADDMREGLSASSTIFVKDPVGSGVRHYMNDIALTLKRLYLTSMNSLD